MLLLILFAAMIVVILLVISSLFLINRRFDRETWVSNNAEEILGVSGVLIGIFVICLVISGSIAGAVQGFKEANYQATLLEKQMLEYRLQEKDENLISSNPLYADINKFNIELLGHKTYCNNLWLNLFHNDKIATIDYIELNLKE